MSRGSERSVKRANLTRTGKLYPAGLSRYQCFGYGNGRFGHPDQNRAISLREAAMLQTFPEDYRFVSDGSPVRFNALGRLIGNAVPVLLGEIIGKVSPQLGRVGRV